MNMNHQKQVITYRLAYVPGEISLCIRHSDAPGLGAVSHGAHVGYCDACPETSQGDCPCGGDCEVEIRQTWSGEVERWACAHT